jgi:predicted dehydrogenase
MNRPRVGFLGTGWIGRDRMEAILKDNAVEAVAIADPSRECAVAAAALAPRAAIAPGLEGLLEHRLDGLVIATPSALHAPQSIAALDAGVAVFCQKPLGRSAAEAAQVVGAARRADRLLAVDFSYRHAAGIQALAALLRDGAFGEVFAIDARFHNAYGPDKPWFYDRAQSGGGCAMDLGVHLIDLILWLFDFPKATRVASRLFANGTALPAGSPQVEDYAVAEFDLAGGAHARLACSWRLHAGQEAEIELTLYGTRGGGLFRNVGGSFYDFEAFRFDGTARSRLVSPPDEWGGRAAAAWAARLCAGDSGFDPAAEELVRVSELVDLLYGEASAPH